MLSIAPNLSSEVSEKSSEIFLELIGRLIEINPCKADMKSFQKFLKGINPQPVKSADDALFLVNMINNFYLTSIGLPRFKISEVSRSFLPSFYPEIGEYVFEYFNLVALNAASDAAIQGQIFDCLVVTAALLPGNVLSSFLNRYLKDNPYNATGVRSDLRQYLCQMQNSFYSLIYRANYDCQNLDSFYGPKTISW